MALSDHIVEIEALRRRGKANAAAVLASLQEIISRGQTIASALAQYQAGTVKLVPVPFFEVIATADLIDAFVDTYFSDLDYSPDLFIDLRAAEAALFNLQTLRLAFSSQAGPNAGITDVFVPGPAPLPTYKIRQGDTLERIALRFLGSVDRVNDIIDLNDLAHPFITKPPGAPIAQLTGEFAASDFDPTEFATSLTAGDFAAGEFEETEFFVGVAPILPLPRGVKTIGDTIYLPADAFIATGATITLEQADVELFGRDLQLANGRLQLDRDGNFLTVEGITNMIQAVSQRIWTLLGELILHPSYGIERLLAVGIEGTRANVILSGVSVARATKEDPRILGLKSLSILFADTVNLDRLVATLIGLEQRNIDLNLVIPESIQIQHAA